MKVKCFEGSRTLLERLDAPSDAAWLARVVDAPEPAPLLTAELDHGEAEVTAQSRRSSGAFVSRGAHSPGRSVRPNLAKESASETLASRASYRANIDPV